MRRRRPLWRAFWCLLLGGLVGWLVAWGLEPRPRWSVQTGKMMMMPLVEWPEQDLVVMNGTELAAGPYGPFSMQLIDSSNGQVRKSIPLQQPMVGVGGEERLPRYFHGAVWWLTRDDNLIRGSWQLMRWDFQHDQKAKVVARWENNWPWQTYVDWRLGSDVFTVEQELRWSWIPLVFTRQHYGLMLLGSLATQIDELWQFRVAESYRLPRYAGEAPDKLHTWRCMLDREFTRYTSVEGRSLQVHLVLHGLRQTPPLSRARALGKPTLTPVEIAYCYLGKSNCIQITDVATGAVMAELPTLEKGSYQRAYWAGPYLITHFREWWSSHSISISELELQRNKPRDELWPPRLMIHRWNGHALEPVPLPDERVWNDWHFEYSHGRLSASLLDREQKPQTIHWMAITSASTVNALTPRRLPGAEWNVVTEPSGTQLIVNQENRVPYAVDLQRWADQRNWLKKLLDWIRPLQWQDTVIYSVNDKHPPHRLSKQVMMRSRQFTHALSSLYTHSYRMDGEQVDSMSLYCYSLPLRIYSPWWPRLTGLLTALTFWLLLTRHARRGVA